LYDTLNSPDYNKWKAEGLQLERITSELYKLRLDSAHLQRLITPFRIQPPVRIVSAGKGGEKVTKEVSFMALRFPAYLTDIICSHERVD